MKVRCVLLALIIAGSGNALSASPGDVKILHTSLAGSGCNNSSAQALISPDFKDLSVLFDNYRVDLGEDGRSREKRDQKKCRIIIHIEVPRGWQFAFRSVDYRGFVSLPAGVMGFHRFSIMSNRARYDAREAIRSFRAAQVKGPINKDFYIHVEQPTSELTWSTCGEPKQQIKLISELMLMSSTKKPRVTELAEMTLDSADASLRQNFSVVWRRCSN